MFLGFFIVIGIFKSSTPVNENLYTQQNSNNSTAAKKLLSACKYGNVEEVHKITRGHALAFQAISGRLLEPFSVACKHNNLNVIKALLENGFLFNPSVLHVACSYRKTEIFKFFFLRIEGQAIFPEEVLASVLHSACSAAAWDILEFLGNYSQ